VEDRYGTRARRQLRDSMAVAIDSLLDARIRLQSLAADLPSRIEPADHVELDLLIDKARKFGARLASRL